MKNIHHKKGRIILVWPFLLIRDMKNAYPTVLVGLSDCIYSVVGRNAFWISMVCYKQLLTILAVLYSTCSYGQIFTTNLVISNKDENDSWLTNLEKQETTEQIKIISDRLITDTLTYLIEPGDRIRLKPQRDSVKIDVHCRPQIILNQIPLYINNETPARTIKELALLLMQADIDKVEV